MKKLFFITIIMVVSLSACKKQSIDDNTLKPSPWLAQMGTSIPETTANADSMKVFVSELQRYRKSKGSAPVYYDSRLDSLMGSKFELTSSYDNAVDAHFHVQKGEITKYGVITGFTGTGESPSKLFASLTYNEPEFSGIFASSRFWSYDIFTFRVQPCTDTCHIGMWKYQFVFWLGIERPTSKSMEEPKMREYKHL